MADYAYSVRRAGSRLDYTPGQNAVWRLFRTTTNNIQKKLLIVDWNMKKNVLLNLLNSINDVLFKKFPNIDELYYRQR